MKNGLPTIAASILALTLASPAFGKAPYPGFERDMALAFENGGEPMELALLSEQEMRDTQGAFVPAFAFLTHWASRIVMGSTYGAVTTGMTNHRNMYSSPMNKWMAASMIYWGFAGFISSNPYVGTAIGVYEYKHPDWGVRHVYNTLRAIDDAYPTLGAFVRRVGEAIDEYSSQQFGDIVPQGDASGASAYSVAQNSENTSFGARLVQRLPQDELRNFFANLPESTLLTHLDMVAAGTTRSDFLENLQPQVVNDLLLQLSEPDMQRFIRIVPASIMNPLLGTATVTRDYWSPHWRT